LFRIVDRHIVLMIQATYTLPHTHTHTLLISNDYLSVWNDIQQIATMIWWEAVNYITAYGEVYSIQLYVIKLVSDLRLLVFSCYSVSSNTSPRNRWNIAESSFNHLLQQHCKNSTLINMSLGWFITNNAYQNMGPNVFVRWFKWDGQKQIDKS
jgi:hypothetical protein